MSLCICMCHVHGKKFLTMGFPHHPCCGCKEDEKMSFCSHGVPVKLACTVCKKESELPVSPMAKQIQELSERIEKIEKDLNHVPCFDYIKDVVKEFESYMNKHCERVDSLEAEINTVRILGSRAYHPKKPHKCPVCEGNQKVLEKLVSFVNAKEHYIDCGSCEGKGIVWA